ncbi:MAG: ABC transporter substrate-binding protein [Deinococcota bacterium]
MKNLLFFAVAFASLGLAQVSQVPGFPAYELPTEQLEVLEDSGDTVLVQHRFGETEVPKNPQRVFADAATIASAVTLGLPVVAGYYWEGTEIIPNWDDQTAGAALEVSGEYAYNFESVLESDPDLILAFSHIIYGSGDQNFVYEQLSAIAPTIVLFNDPTELWFQGLFELSAIFELSEAESNRLAAAEDTIAAACKPLQDAVGDDTVMLIQPLQGGLWVIGPGFMDNEHFLPYSLTSHLYYFCGLNAPENLVDFVGINSGAQMSQELIGDIQADHLLIDTFGGTDAYEEIIASPLWQAVPAVQKGQVYPIPNLFSGSYDMTLNAIEVVTSFVTQGSQ